MTSRTFWGTVILGSFITPIFFFLTSLPLGVPDEWVWNRIGYSDPGAMTELITNVILFSFVAIPWLFFVRWGAQRVSSVATQKWLLLVLTLASFFLASFLQTIPGRSSFPKSWVLYYPAMSGYFHLARYEMQDSATFLSTYEGRMSEGDVLHVGTHPPGLFLLNRWLWTVCESSPTLTNLGLTLISSQTQEEFDTLEATLAMSGGELKASDRVSLWVSKSLTELVAVAALIPLFLLLRRQVSSETAWWISASWPLLPSLILFLPKSDALFPTLGLLFLMYWVSSVVTQSWPRAILAGVVFWCGSLLSLAIVPMGLVAGVYSLLVLFSKSSNPDQQRRGIKTVLRTVFVSLLTFLGLTLAMGVLCEINLFTVWVWNYKNHASFYEQFTRTYGKWLIANPIETYFALGAPLFIAALFGLRVSWKASKDASQLVWAGGLVWAAIWISGKNSGEAARLWLVFFPIALLFAAQFLETLTQNGHSCHKSGLRLLVLQMIVSVITVAAMSGFSV
ncbi:hypothetical protein OAL44_02030 [Planctomycetaceae bacterium]|jgi:methylthioxylose transferase|nr:hypothetical protein [bacterium]MDC0274380.1 hypothetical protein [Planctomycetaceae bacterium]MDC0307892.1 hypothetical protein [Planctomycetaceae bacterium]